MNRLGDIWVCEDCYIAHHYGVTVIDREATDDECHDWHGGYLRSGHDVPNVIEETEVGLLIREFFAGESDTPADREPLALCKDVELADNTDPETDDGIDMFSYASCEGCGSRLGGSRYRLAMFTTDGAS